MTQGDWRPSASHAALLGRARTLAAVRQYFAETNVLEVETPVIGQHAVSDPFVESIAVEVNDRQAWLRSSPEYHMKRLLATYPESIYQIGKVFRAGESGRLHRPEFTMVEWYRVNTTFTDIIADTCKLISVVVAELDFPLGATEHHSYRELFRDSCGIDPIDADTPTLCERAIELLPETHPDTLRTQLGEDRHGWLDLLLSHCIVPSLAGDRLHVVTHYPAEQAMLARLDPENPDVALRFEVILNGVELANGYEELRDAEEQFRRFDDDNRARRSAGQEAVEPDSQLLDALRAGLPPCSGVALGLDRLLMMGLHARELSEVVSFPPAT